MTNQRFSELMNDDSKALTPEEIAEGWHFCSEFDGLLVNSNEPEDGQFCHANCGSAKL